MLVRKKNKHTNNSNDYKIFVGNVPYDCVQDEFYECFKNIEGFKNAELIINSKTDISRGFGFITINSQSSADKLRKQIIIFKDRELRFTNYKTNTNIYEYDGKNNYIYVNNIPKGKNRDWLLSCFKDYGEIGKYLILTDSQTGEYKTSGVIEILNDDIYRTILSKKYIICDDDIKLNISRYKIQIYNKY